MPLKTIEQTMTISASRERVWDVLLSEEYFPQWTAEFMEGSYAETDWQEGSRVRFLTPDGSGIAGQIVASDRPALLDIRYDGQVIEGKEDYDSPEAQELRGAHETYRLSEQDGGTSLAIASDMAEAYYADMSEAWQRALAKVKALAEAS